MNTTKSSINKRTFLKASGIAIGLPMLETFAPRLLRASSASASPKAQRLVCVGTYLGYYTPAFFPKTAGQGYEMPPSLKPLELFRSDFTVFSGLDHRAPNGHAYWKNFLTGTATSSVSLDQIVANRIGAATRLSSLELTTGGSQGRGDMCFTKEGVALPMIDRPSVVFEKLFASGANSARTEWHLIGASS